MLTPFPLQRLMPCLHHGSISVNLQGWKWVQPSPASAQPCWSELSKEAREFKSKINVEHVLRGERKWRVRNRICQCEGGDTSRAPNWEGRALWARGSHISHSHKPWSSWLTLCCQWANWVIGLYFGKGSSKLSRSIHACYCGRNWGLEGINDLPKFTPLTSGYRLSQFTSLFSLALSPRILVVKGVTCSIISLPCTLSIDVDLTHSPGPL